MSFLSACHWFKCHSYKPWHGNLQCLIFFPLSHGLKSNDLIWQSFSFWKPVFVFLQIFKPSPSAPAGGLRFPAQIQATNKQTKQGCFCSQFLFTTFLIFPLHLVWVQSVSCVSLARKIETDMMRGRKEIPVLPAGYFNSFICTGADSAALCGRLPGCLAVKPWNPSRLLRTCGVNRYSHLGTAVAVDTNNPVTQCFSCTCGHLQYFCNMTQICCF